MQCCGPSPPSADRSGNHGKSSQCTGGRPGCARTRMPSDPCQVHRNLASQLSSRGLFLSRAAVRRHIAASKPCRAAKLQVGHGIREILVDVRTSDVMAGAGGGAPGPRPTSNINQKVPCVGNVLSSVFRPCFMIIYHQRVHAGGVMDKATGCYA